MGHAFPPRPVIAAALLAGLLPGGGWGDSLALFATVAALVAAGERRDRDMLLAAGLAAGLAPAGLLLAPLCLGLAFRRGVVRHLPGAGLAGAAIATMLPWAAPVATLPNLAALAMHVPASLALVVAIGTGLAAWLAARAASLPTTTPALFAEARLGMLVLASALPLPPGAIGVLLLVATLPLPAPPRAANDNCTRRIPVRLTA